ncbi:tpr repeat-containing protein [Anaeramoeba flamelloides]|uniref:Tpr repeat-containing protein n=1 Tax=Anaeramoeba flamelloides TaxID=1746091 RepID=A0ABQ8XJY7_9EUKA|nr:tpr repeat-containing protein [Anaeramoeba flamelloides]
MKSSLSTRAYSHKKIPPTFCVNCFKNNKKIKAIIYCSNCKAHLCDECSKSESHKEHSKIPISRAKRYFDIAQFMETKKNYKLALQYYHWATIIQPTHIYAFTNLSIVHFYLQEYDSAFYSCYQALLIDPKTVFAYHNLGVFNDQLGRHENAVEIFKYALKLDPKNEEIHYNMGNSLFQLERVDKAIESLNQAIKLQPNHFQALISLATAYEKKNQIQRSIEILEKASKINPDHPLGHLNMGIMCYNHGFLAQAKKSLERVVSIGTFRTKLAKEILQQIQQRSQNK